MLPHRQPKKLSFAIANTYSFLTVHLLTLKIPGAHLRRTNLIDGDETLCAWWAKGKYGTGRRRLSGEFTIQRYLYIWKKKSKNTYKTICFKVHRIHIQTLNFTLKLHLPQRRRNYAKYDLNIDENKMSNQMFLTHTPKVKCYHLFLIEI